MIHPHTAPSSTFPQPMRHTRRSTETAFPWTSQSREEYEERCGFILTQSYQKVSIRVLHPLIPEDDYTQIFRGLPEGSRLSPTLFGILISDLLQEIKHKHPNSDTIGPEGPTWVGALAFVDDLVLASRFLYELQNMINTCQRWCEKARIEINTDKAKIVHFNKPATNLRQASPGHSNTCYINKQPTSAAAPHGQVTILNTDSFKYLGVTLDHLLNRKELQEQIKSIEVSNAKLQRMLNEIRSSRNYYIPHKSTLGGASPAPNTTLHLWKSCVLVQATQYIKYMPPNHIKDIQIALNKTLLQTFSCHEPASQPLTLMADLGIPPLTHYRHLDLVKFHYRFTNFPTDSIPKNLYSSRTIKQRVMDLPQIETHMRDSILTLFPRWKPEEPLTQPKHLDTVLECNREKSFARSLHPVISQLWKEELLAQAQEPPTTRLPHTYQLRAKIYTDPIYSNQPRISIYPPKSARKASSASIPNMRKKSPTTKP